MPSYRTDSANNDAAKKPPVVAAPCEHDEANAKATADLVAARDAHAKLLNPDKEPEEVPDTGSPAAVLPYPNKLPKDHGVTIEYQEKTDALNPKQRPDKYHSKFEPHLTPKNE